MEMSKGLDALKNIKRERPIYFHTLYDLDMWKEDIETIEKELKVLNILKRACSNGVFNITSQAIVDSEGYVHFDLPKEEYDMIKESFSDE